MVRVLHWFVKMSTDLAQTQFIGSQVRTSEAHLRKLPSPPEPVIKVTGGRNIEVPVGTDYEDMGATALDDVDGDVSASIAVDTSEVDTSKTGSFTVWYSVTDSNGNYSRKSRAVKVIPPRSPTIFFRSPLQF